METDRNRTCKTWFRDYWCSFDECRDKSIVRIAVSKSVVKGFGSMSGEVPLMRVEEAGMLVGLGFVVFGEKQKMTGTQQQYRLE